ncbi:MAG: ATP-binding protein [Dehalococcoidia bacterium]
MSLRTRLLTGYSVLVMLIVAGFGVILYVTMEQALSSEMDRRLEVRASQVQLSIWPGATSVASGNLLAADLDTHPLAVPGGSGVYVQVTDPSGDIVARSESLREAVLPVDSASLNRAVQGERVFADLMYGGSQPIRLLLVPVLRDGNVIGVLHIGQSRVSLQDTLADLRSLLLGLGVIALVLAIGLGWLLTHGGLRRLHVMARRAAEIAGSRDFAQRLNDRGPDDEVGQLVHTFDRLLATVDETLRIHREFVADTSHELRNPLHALRTNLDLLGRLTSDEEREECLREARQQLERVSRITDDLLTLAQVEASRVVEAVPVDLLEVVEATIEQFQRAAPERSFVLQPAEDVEVLGDTGRLHQILANLLDNAVKYSQPGSRISIGLRQIASHAELTVNDQGVGIAADQLPHIFERFYRADRRAAQHGSGLGLAIVKHLVEAHDGDVRAESTPGSGTTFTVRLPGRTRAAPTVIVGAAALRSDARPLA